MSQAVDVARADGFEHPALFYAGAHEYVAGTVPFIEAGVQAGEPVAAAVPRPNLELLRRELGDTAQHVQLLDMTEVGRNPGWIIPGVLRAFADEHHDRRVRIIGEPIWPGRSETEYPACAQHEALINLAFAARAATILCPYDVEGLDPQVLADAEATHPTLVDTNGPRRSNAYAPDHVVATYNQPLPGPGHAPEFAVDGGSIRQARHFAAEQARRAGLPTEQMLDLELAVSELIANTVTHGGGSGTLCVWADGGHVICELRDSGTLTDPLVGRRPADTNQIGGRGLLLVNHLCDLVRVHTTDADTAIRVHFRLP